MKPRVALLLKLLFWFFLLYGLRDWIVLGYRAVLQPVGSLLLAVEVKDFVCDEVCALRIVAFLSLVLVTPKVKLGQRLVAILVGLTVFVGIDLAGLFLWSQTHPLQQVAGETFFQLTYQVVWILLRDLLLPFLLWMVAFDRHLGLIFSP